MAKLKIQDVEIFTEEERLKLEKILNVDQEQLNLSIKTVQYIFKRILKYIFMPNDLKTDLKGIGLNDDKAESIVKVWSAETRSTLDDIGPLANDQSDSQNFSWKINAELSSDYHKKCKIPKAYLSLNKPDANVEMEVTHPELYSIFLQFESIQNTLDNLVMKT